MDFIAHGEEPEEYERLLVGFREQFRPSGCGEELEVERITQSWWRLKRAYRYENAMNKVAQLDIAKRQLMEYERHLKALEEKEKSFVQLLESSRDEILSAGQIPAELNTKLLALVPEYQDLWLDSERPAERVMDQGVLSNTGAKPHKQENASIRALPTPDGFIEGVQMVAEERRAFLTEIAVAQHVIPNSDAINNILRYETSIERSLNRALERLERMQRTRQGKNSIGLAE
jgi:hypothetical protein